jgi:hypothetical protein
VTNIPFGLLNAEDLDEILRPERLANASRYAAPQPATT